MRSGFSLPLLAGLLAMQLTACGDGGQGAAQGGQQQAPQAGYITVQAKTLTLDRELPGRTTAHQIAEVRPQVSGVIEKRLFEEGAKVKAGQPLYQIDDRTYKADLASAQASEAQARATLESKRLLAERYKSLLAKKSISQQTYDEAQAALEENRAAVAAARAKVQAARINLDYATIKAPISGRIGRSTVTAGALVTANQAQALATIRQLDPIYVDLTQSSTEMQNLRRAMESGQLQQVSDDQAKVTLMLEDGSPYDHSGTLQFSEYAVDESTGSVTLRALFPNPQGNLLPGMFVRAKLPEGQRSQAILVPQKGITHDPTGQASAMVIGDNNMVEKVDVSTVRAVGNQWLIASGLKAGDRLIVDGLQKIRPGSPVTPVDMSSPDSQKANAANQNNAAQ
ncbi:multidrug/solvent RND membrane fusion protein [Alcanivorax hongdengensis A-11-3]|uniref:Multidrug/solvent RND membrane fusion protein n=1 Tax=Alcanivorax hongdengensis A-11-3 TaxID=1177179 RepID=L0WDQ8_9GAMM|nr:efflux RND transporter periplasmic adaptor subunit [Alcanivorax hongdengensis]EKF74943.1 multidrug/solvent RND membrane fusion protein [Alcanivorax hongdengensis A-11-3]